MIKKLVISFLLLTFFSVFIVGLYAQLGSSKGGFTRQDTLRGSLNENRTWWDVLHYDVLFDPDFENKTIKGKTKIEYKVVSETKNRMMQVDLQAPLQITSLWYDGKQYINDPAYPYKNDGNVWLIPLPGAKLNSIHTLTIEYNGQPKLAKNPPWDGGLVWKKDKIGNIFTSIACQGLGGSVWYPCKDHQSDEPDNGAILEIEIPDSLTGIGNGNFISKTTNGNGKTIWKWEVKNPINSYNIIPYIGKYVNFKDTFNGLKGPLTLSYWVLEYNLEKAKIHFTRDVKPMLQCFEDWFGPYPFYEDGYKLVEAPYFGMEHQSSIAYGNGYRDGYSGSDLSGSGTGRGWDYIIIHESGHEWFGNNITTNDIADMWVHEGFTTYSEVLFVECQQGKQAANKYAQGLRKGIRNQNTIIGPYNVNEEGNGDMYSKGANLIHTIRQIINDDVKFKSILRGLNKDFYHKTVTSFEVEKYISAKAGINFSKVFDQYLRNVNVPSLEYKINDSKIEFHWINVIEGFAMPAKIEGTNIWLNASQKWQSIERPAGITDTLNIDKNFYILTSKAK